MLYKQAKLEAKQIHYKHDASTTRPSATPVFMSRYFFVLSLDIIEDAFRALLQQPLASVLLQLLPIFGCVSPATNWIKRIRRFHRSRPPRCFLGLIFAMLTFRFSAQLQT